MSEREPNFESGKRYEIDGKLFDDQHEKIREQKEKAAEEAEAKRDSLEAIQELIEKAAKDRAETAAAETVETPAASESVLHAAHKGMANHSYNQMIQRTRKQMSAPQKAFSKFIHKPTVEALSNVGQETVARPSGLLVGGIFSVLGSLVTLYICRHYGYEYNFLIGLAGFAGGFVVGVIGEGLYKLIKR